MRFLIDAQPPGLARWLAEKGHHAVHVNALGLGAAPDDAVEAKAREMGAVIWSKDADFAERARRVHGLQVVWLRVGNTTNASLRAKLARDVPTIESALANGESLIEIL
ncbi:MAG: DUF5615 family PIN-like protein [Gammaproteobacteria bacterium]|nr:DUF5615 family PIN-like protein [Gammaproteobacteria bacterium]